MYTFRIGIGKRKLFTLKKMPEAINNC